MYPLNKQKERRYSNQVTVLLCTCIMKYRHRRWSEKMSPQRKTSFLQPGLVFVFKIIRVQKSPIVFIVNFQDDFLFLVTTFSFFHFFYHFHFYCQWDAVHILTVLPSPTRPPTHPHPTRTKQAFLQCSTHSLFMRKLFINLFLLAGHRGPVV